MKSIQHNGTENHNDHRLDFESCPHCDFKQDSHIWLEQSHTLVLEPRFYKAGHVTVIAECPKCFNSSWVHWGFDHFNKWTDTFPKTWVRAVEKQAAKKRLFALREWAMGLCGKCKKLETGKIEYNTWRTCKRGGCGPVENKCESFKEFID